MFCARARNVSSRKPHELHLVSGKLKGSGNAPHFINVFSLFTLRESSYDSRPNVLRSYSSFFISNQNSCIVNLSLFNPNREPDMVYGYNAVSLFRAEKFTLVICRIEIGLNDKKNYFRAISEKNLKLASGTSVKCLNFLTFKVGKKNQQVFSYLI